MSPTSGNDRRDDQQPSSRTGATATMTNEQPTATDEAVDLNPQRCAYTWTPLGRYSPDRIRCTARADEGAEHSHRWDSREQDGWSLSTIRTFIDAMEPQPITRGEAWNIPILLSTDDHGAASCRHEVTDAQVNAAADVLERCGLTLQHRSHVRAALEAAAKA